MADGATSGQHFGEPVERAPALRVVSDDVGDSGAETNAPTGLPASDKPRSKGGRPRGSRNRVTTDVRARLGELTPKLVEDIYREAHLGYTWNTLKGGGRERVQLTPSERFERIKLLLDKSLPSLKGVEADVKTTDTTREWLHKKFNGDERQINRHIARSVLATMRNAGLKLYVEEDNRTDDLQREHGQEQIDADLSAAPDGVDAAGAASAPAAPSLDDLPDLPNAPFYPGQTWRPWVGSGYFIQCIDGAALWRVVSAKGVLVGEDHPNVRVAAAACLDLAGPRPVPAGTSKKEDHWQ